MAATEPPPGGGMPQVKYPPGSDFFAFGGLGCVFSHPDRPNQVIKVPSPYAKGLRAMEIEKRVYKRLGSHPNLVKWTDMDDYGIWFELIPHGNLRDFYANGGKATTEQKVQWCQDTAAVLQFVHGKNVRHADVSGRNLLVDSDMIIKLCDFGGSSIDEDKAMVFAESGYRHPDREEYLSPTIRAEIHSLGSTIYEIITEKQPHQGLEDHEVDGLIAKHEYPDLSEVPLQEVILMCWEGKLKSASEVAEQIALYGMSRTYIHCRNIAAD
jgi:serine/threonine protein kinase